MRRNLSSSNYTNLRRNKMADLSIPRKENLTKEEIINICKSFEQMESVGFTDEEIGRYVPKDWVPQLMEKPVDKRKLTRNPERQEQVKELLIKGMSMQKIAEELKVSIGTVQYWRYKIGPIETKSGKKKAKEEVDSKEEQKKRSERIERTIEYWIRMGEDHEFRVKEFLCKDGLTYEQAQEKSQNYEKKKNERERTG